MASKPSRKSEQERLFRIARTLIFSSILLNFAVSSARPWVELTRLRALNILFRFISSIFNALMIPWMMWVAFDLKSYTASISWFLLHLTRVRSDQRKDLLRPSAATLSSCKYLELQRGRLSSRSWYLRGFCGARKLLQS